MLSAGDSNLLPCQEISEALRSNVPRSSCNLGGSEASFLLLIPRSCGAVPKLDGEASITRFQPQFATARKGRSQTECGQNTIPFSGSFADSGPKAVRLWPLEQTSRGVFPFTNGGTSLRAMSRTSLQSTVDTCRLLSGRGERGCDRV